MKILLSLLLLTGYGYAQVPTKFIHRDSLPEIFPPVMPRAKPNNWFYRSRIDPKNVLRATLDNMPVKVPDSSTYYTLLQSYETYLKADATPHRWFKPQLRVVPKQVK